MPFKAARCLEFIRGAQLKVVLLCHNIIMDGEVDSVFTQLKEYFLFEWLRKLVIHAPGMASKNTVML